MKKSEYTKKIAELEKKVKKEQKIMIFLEVIFAILAVPIYLFLFKMKNFRINWVLYGILGLISFFLFSLIMINEYRLNKALKKLKEEESLMNEDEDYDIDF